MTHRKWMLMASTALVTGVVWIGGKRWHNVPDGIDLTEYMKLDRAVNPWWKCLGWGPA